MVNIEYEEDMDDGISSTSSPSRSTQYVNSTAFAQHFQPNAFDAHTLYANSLTNASHPAQLVAFANHQNNLRRMQLPGTMNQQQNTSHPGLNSLTSQQDALQQAQFAGFAAQLDPLHQAQLFDFTDQQNGLQQAQLANLASLQNAPPAQLVGFTDQQNGLRQAQQVNLASLQNDLPHAQYAALMNQANIPYQQLLANFASPPSLSSTIHSQQLQYLDPNLQLPNNYPYPSIPSPVTPALLKPNLFHSLSSDASNVHIPSSQASTSSETQLKKNQGPCSRPPNRRKTQTKSWETQCKRCRRFGHKWETCMMPSPEGWLTGCPKCQTSRHSYDEYPAPKDDFDNWKFILACKVGRPPLWTGKNFKRLVSANGRRTFYTYKERLEREHANTPGASPNDEPVAFAPWTAAFAKADSQLYMTYRYWDGNPDQEEVRIRDPAWDSEATINDSELYNSAP